MDCNLRKHQQIKNTTKAHKTQQKSKKKKTKKEKRNAARAKRIKKSVNNLTNLMQKCSGGSFFFRKWLKQHDEE